MAVHGSSGKSAVRAKGFLPVKGYRAEGALRFSHVAVDCQITVSDLLLLGPLPTDIPIPYMSPNDDDDDGRLLSREILDLGRGTGTGGGSDQRTEVTLVDIRTVAAQISRPIPWGGRKIPAKKRTHKDFICMKLVPSA